MTSDPDLVQIFLSLLGVQDYLQGCGERTPILGHASCSSILSPEEP
jgi:hypothetical protein